MIALIIFWFLWPIHLLGADCTDAEFIAALNDLSSISKKVSLTPELKADYKVGGKVVGDFRAINGIESGDGKVLNVKFLGAGSNGLVYDIIDNKMDSQVIKIPRDSFGSMEIIKEVNSAKKLQETSIPYARIFESDSKGRYIIKEKIEGVSLSSIKNYSDKQMQQLVHIFKESVSKKVALDLKKDNFILDQNDQIVLIDYAASNGAQTYYATGRAKDLWRNMFSSNDEYEVFLRRISEP